jgi:hypothetical protein
VELRLLIGTFVPDPYLDRLLLLSTLDNSSRRMRAEWGNKPVWDGVGLSPCVKTSVSWNIYKHRSLVLMNAARYNAFRGGIDENKLSTRTHSMHWDLLHVIHQRTHICEALNDVWRPKLAYNLRANPLR